MTLIRAFWHVACIRAYMEPKLYADTLKMAADTLGSSKNLARRLGISLEELELWISGRKAAPLEAFATALEILGERPYLKAVPHLRGGSS